VSDVAREIRQILDPILESMGLVLWDMEFQRHGPKWLLRVYIDREPGGVTLDDCEQVSRDLSIALDVEDIISHAYTLEVSSPGLDRTLSKPEHFTRFIGSIVKVKTYQPIENQKVIRGKLLGMNDGVIKIELETTAVLDIPLSNVTKASLEVEI
jgi:ribosome maturation factor RimP